jgi:hypothetical protein
MKAFRMIGLCGAILLAGGVGLAARGEAGPEPWVRPAEDALPELQTRLTPLATKLGKPRPGEWLFEHKESGQTFDEYRAAQPVRRNKHWHTIYLCLIGDFGPEQKRIQDLTAEYLGLFYDVPVKAHKQIPLREIPARARRKHPKWGDEQILTTYVLEDLLSTSRLDGLMSRWTTPSWWACSNPRAACRV